MELTLKQNKTFFSYQCSKFLLVLLCTACTHKPTYPEGESLTNLPLWPQLQDKRVLQRVQITARGVDLSLNAIADISETHFEGLAFLEAGAPLFHFIKEGNDCKVIATPRFAPAAVLCDGVYSDLEALFSGFVKGSCPQCRRRLDSEQILTLSHDQKPRSLFRFKTSEAKLQGLPQEVEITNHIYGYKMQVRFLEIKRRP